MELKEQLKREMVVAAGAYDCYSSRIMEHAGYKAIILCGGVLAGTENADLVTLDDMYWAASRMTLFEEIPVLADIRNGFGESAAHVARAVKRLEHAGIQGIIVDDSSCAIDCETGVVSGGAWKTRVKAAVEAAQACVVIAAVCGRAPLEERIERCREALRLGADMVCIRSLETEAEVRSFAKAIPSGKMWYDSCSADNWPAGFDLLRDLGFGMIYHSFAAESAMWGMLAFGRRTVEDGNTVYHDDHDFDGLIPGTSQNVLFNLHEIWIPMEKRFNNLGETAALPDTVKTGGQ